MKNHTNLTEEIQEVKTKKDYLVPIYGLALFVGACILIAHPYIIKLVD